jgi:hypothetical protein
LLRAHTEWSDSWQRCDFIPAAIVTSPIRAFGKNGFFTIPDAYLTNPELTYDFWTIGGKTGW